LPSLSADFFLSKDVDCGRCSLSSPFLTPPFFFSSTKAVDLATVLGFFPRLTVPPPQTPPLFFPEIGGPFLGSLFFREKNIYRFGCLRRGCFATPAPPLPSAVMDRYILKPTLGFCLSHFGGGLNDVPFLSTGFFPFVIMSTLISAMSKSNSTLAPPPPLSFYSPSYSRVRISRLPPFLPGESPLYRSGLFFSGVAEMKGYPPFECRSAHATQVWFPPFFRRKRRDVLVPV